MSSVFISGMEGFTAGHLVPILEAHGHDVRGIAREDGEPERDIFACDLFDYDRLSGLIRELRPEVAIHLAAITHTAEDPRTTYDTNISGTRNLLRALAESPHPPGLVLLASSGAVYGRSAVDPIHEDVRPSPESDYAVSKLAMEHMARLWKERLPLAVVRPFNYTGVGQPTSFVIPKIVDHFRRGASRITLGNIDVERDFSDVRSVCEAYAGLVEARPAGETFNVCSGTARSLHEVLDAMAEIAGYRIEVDSDPALMRAHEVQRLRGSPEKLMATVAEWSPIPFPETLEWMYREPADSDR